MTTAARRWEVPEAVDPPSGARLRALYERVSKAVGLRDAGWVCLVVGVVALGLGLGLGWREFVVVGVVAVVIVGIALLFTIGKPNLGVGIRVSDRSVVVGERASGDVVVSNVATRRHLGSRLDLPVGRDQASFWLPMLLPGAHESFSFRIPTNRRGRVVVGPAQSVQGDPFSLAGRETQWTEELEVFVHPRTVRLPGRQTGFVHDLEGHASPNITPSDMNFHALRPYVAGDDRRHVHWRSTARAGQLMVRQFEESRMSRVLIALDTGRNSYIDDEEFELAVSIVGSIAMQTHLGESPLTVLTSNQRLVTVSATSTMDELAVLELTARGGLADLSNSATQREPGASIAFVVSGSSSSMTDLRLANARFDVDTRYIGIRVAAGEELRSRKVGSITVTQVGSLDELPRAMRRAME
ncbi:MAG: DUF58 domain-containing protein [Propionibacterium sp.]|nr:DUF58 domain-containing protein [Propionibacterium sp.]